MCSICSDLHQCLKVLLLVRTPSVKGEGCILRDEDLAGPLEKGMVCVNLWEEVRDVKYMEGSR